MSGDRVARHAGVAQSIGQFLGLILRHRKQQTTRRFRIEHQVGQRGIDAALNLNPTTEVLLAALAATR